MKVSIDQIAIKDENLAQAWLAYIHANLMGLRPQIHTSTDDLINEINLKECDESFAHAYFTRKIYSDEKLNGNNDNYPMRVPLFEKILVAPLLEGYYGGKKGYAVYVLDHYTMISDILAKGTFFDTDDIPFTHQKLLQEAVDEEPDNFELKRRLLQSHHSRIGQDFECAPNIAPCTDLTLYNINELEKIGNEIGALTHLNEYIAASRAILDRSADNDLITRYFELNWKLRSEIHKLQQPQ